MTLHTSTDKPSNSLRNPMETGQTNLADWGKNLLAEALQPVAGELDFLEKNLRSYLEADSETSASVIEHVFKAGGKRIRPALYFFSANLFNYRGEHLYPIAAVCEYVHTASLLHDDVVDSSTLRRNKPTANSIWGDQASVLVGDLIYSTASEMMAATGSLEVVKAFARAIRLMSEGELLQLEAVFNYTLTREQYFAVIQRKTAALIGASCKSAALLANRPESEVAALLHFGESLGIAFQLVDDALDYLGHREIFGKPTLSDLKEGKLTLPVIMLRDLATSAELEVLRQVIGSQKTSSDEIAQVLSLVEKYETAEKTIEEARTFTDQALDSLSIFPDSAAKANLEKIAQRLVWRFY